MSDTIRRIQNKTECYTVMLNECLQRPDLSARAKGLYAYLMTLPNDWKLYRDELVTHFTEGKDAINTAFCELETAGYIHKERKLNQGRFDGWDYTIYESSTITGKPDSGKPQTEKPYTENPQLLNTNLIQSTNKQSTDKQITKHKYGTFQNVLLTDDEKQRLVVDFHALADMAIQYLSEYKVEKDYTSKSDNLTIRRWVIDAVRKKQGLPPIHKPITRIESRLCPHCHVPLKGSACPQCYANFDMNGKEI